MDDFSKLQQLASDFAISMAAFDTARHDAEDMLKATGERLKMEHELATSRAAELEKTANDPTRSETVRRVAAGELVKLKSQAITTTPEESAAFSELLEQQRAALRDLKDLQEAAKVAAEAAAKRIQSIRAEIVGNQRPGLANRWIESQQAAFDRLSVGGVANGAETH